jgi:hypothetical protein
MQRLTEISLAKVADFFLSLAFLCKFLSFTRKKKGGEDEI